MTSETKPCPRCERMYVQPVLSIEGQVRYIRPVDWTWKGGRAMCIHCGLMGGERHITWSLAIREWNSARWRRTVGVGL